MTGRADDRVQVPPDAFVRTTRQLWKLVAGALVMPIPTVIYGFWAVRQIRPDQPAAEAIMSIGLLVLLAGAIAWFLASVRCPRCGARLVAAVMRSPEGLGALTSMLGRRDCPSCGWDPRGPSASTP